ncbi:MAG TPA: hypothetical protein VF573_07760 [Paraburkholderia sp.]|uniref:hypothetical protein n=1 Tax=Paraburkholderia sp. TaxID=1926495 RepID=UPI002ED568D1
MKSRTPSDFAIVAIFQDKRKPQNAVGSPFPRDFTAMFQRYGCVSGFCKPGPENLPLLAPELRFKRRARCATSVDRSVTVNFAARLIGRSAPLDRSA